VVLYSMRQSSNDDLRASERGEGLDASTSSRTPPAEGLDEWVLPGEPGSM